MKTRRPIRGITIALASIAVASALILLEEPMDPEAECCDHLFYRAQSVAWLGLDEPAVLSIPAGNRLDAVYDEYYYDRANGLTRQPPYVYRVAVPALAGALGKLTDIDHAYRVLHWAVLATIAFLSGYAVLSLTGGAMVPALGATIVVLATPQMARSFADNYMVTDPASIMIVSLVLLLTIRRDFFAASLVAAFVAPLVKETLVPLALSVALAAWISGRPRRVYWVLAVVPLVLQAFVRSVMSVADRPRISEMFVLEDPYLGLLAFAAAFAPVMLLLVGLIERSIRLWVVSFLPLAVGLLVITTSAIADGPRIWLTFWPVLLALGLGGLWRIQGPAWLKYSWLAVLVASAAIGSLAGLRPEVAPLRWLALLLSLAALGLLMLQFLGSPSNPRDVQGSLGPE